LRTAFLSLQTTELVRPFCSQAFFRRGRFLGLSVLKFRKQYIAVDLQLWICAICVRRLTWCISGYWSPCRNLFTPFRCRRIREAPTCGGGGGNRTPVQNDFFLRVRDHVAHTNTVYMLSGQAKFHAAEPRNVGDGSRECQIGVVASRLVSSRPAISVRIRDSCGKADYTKSVARAWEIRNPAIEQHHCAGAPGCRGWRARKRRNSRRAAPTRLPACL